MSCFCSQPPLRISAQRALAAAGSGPGDIRRGNLNLRHAGLWRCGANDQGAAGGPGATFEAGFRAARTDNPAPGATPNSFCVFPWHA